MSNSEQTPPSSSTLADLARQTVDLWQEEVARLATQPETLALLARTFSTVMAASGMTSNQAHNPGKSPASPQSSAESSSSTRTSHDSSACSSASGSVSTSSSHHAGTATHNDAPMDGDSLLKCLLNHVVQLEQRVDKLERKFDELLQNRSSVPPSRYPESIS